MVFAAKTAKVWRYFDQLPPIEQAAECKICRKKIKATNSSTTGMIRHLRSCHAEEYKCLQEARQSSMIQKAEEKAKAMIMENQKKSNSNNGDSAAIATGNAISNVIMNGHLSPKRERVPTSLTPSANTATAPAVPIKKPKLEHNVNVNPTPVSLPPTQVTKSQPAFRKRQSRDYYWPDEHPFAKKITTQLGLMMIVDKETSVIVEREGLRHLIRAMAPKYRIPTADKFEKAILPELINQLKTDMSRLHQLALNNETMDSVDCPLNNDPEPSPSTTDCHSDEAASDTVSTTAEDSENAIAYRTIADYVNGTAMTMQQMLMKSILNAQDISQSFNYSIQLKKEDEEESATRSVKLDRLTKDQQRRLEEFYTFVGENVFQKSLVSALVLTCQRVHDYFTDSAHPLRLSRLSALGAVASNLRNDNEDGNNSAPIAISALRFVHRRIDALRLYRDKIGLAVLNDFFTEADICLMDDLIAHIECL